MNNQYSVEILHNDNNTKGLIIVRAFTESQYNSVNCYDITPKNKNLLNYQLKLIDMWNRQQPNNYKYKLIVE